jgi:hypothetical protein
VTADESQVCGRPVDAAEGQEKGNVAEASVEISLERALSLAFFKGNSVKGKKMNPDGCCRSASVEVIEFERFGSSGWTRTSNPPVNSRMLCH